MHLAERDRDPSEQTDVSTEEGPALRDAAALTERAADDEAQANAARERFRLGPIEALEPDDAVRRLTDEVFRSAEVLARKERTATTRDETALVAEEKRRKAFHRAD